MTRFRYRLPFDVLRSRDGDTIVGELVLFDGLRMPAVVRVALIDTPEKGQPLAAAATALAEALVPAGSRVTITASGRDKYGRVLASVELADGSDLGETLVARGLASRWDGKGTHPLLAAAA